MDRRLNIRAFILGIQALAGMGVSFGAGFCGEERRTLRVDRMDRSVYKVRGISLGMQKLAHVWI